MPTDRFSEAYDLYLSLRSSYIQPSTLTTYQDARRFLLSALPDKPADEYMGVDLLHLVRAALTELASLEEASQNRPLDRPPSSVHKEKTQPHKERAPWEFTFPTSLIFWD